MGASVNGNALKASTEQAVSRMLLPSEVKSNHVKALIDNFKVGPKPQRKGTGFNKIRNNK